MYCNFFGFSRNPFSLIAQANCDYLPTSHQLISNQLAKSLNKTTGVSCLLGPVGVGKSTLIRKMVIDYKNQSGDLIFKELNANDVNVTDQISILTSNNATNTPKSELADDLSITSQQHQKIIYLLDHADSLSDDFLEELLTIIWERNETKNSVLLILIGSSLLASQLESLRFEYYKFLLNDSFILERLDHHAVNDYILHRLHLAEYAGETLFDDSAIQAIAKLSKGIPRVINTLCGNSLFQASLYQQRVITEETVNSAAEFCLLEEDIPEVEVSAETPAATSDHPLADKVLELPDEFIAQSLKQVAQMLAESGHNQNQADATQNTLLESDLEQQSSVKSQHTIVKAIESVIPRRQDSSSMNAQEVKQEEVSPILPIKASNDAVISSKTTETKPVLEPNHNSDVIPEIPNHSNTDSKHIGFDYKKSFIAAAALLSIVTLIWVVGQQPTKQSNFDVANTDKKIQIEAHGELKTIHDPEESLEVANIAPLDTAENPLDSTETKEAQNDVSSIRLEQPEQVVMPAITENETVLETKIDSPHGQDIEYSNKDVIRANIATLLAKARTQEDSRRLTLPEGDNAVETFRYLLKIDPDNVGAIQGIRRIKKIFIQQAERFKNQGQWQKAEIATAKALQLDPDNSTLANLLAHIKQHIESSSKTTTHTATQITESLSSSNLLDHHEKAANRNFIAAAENGDNALLQVFIDANMPVDATDDLTQNTVLIAAAKKGHLKTITLILANNPNINWQNLNGQTALITAVENGHHSVVSHLLLHGANLHIRDNLGRDALMLAVEKNQVATFKKLSARGASKHTKQHIESSSKTTTHTATQITKSLSSSNLLGHQEQTTKQRASARYQLAQRGITFNFKNFIAAAENGDNALLQVFLDANMPVDVQDDLTQNTVLIAAAKEGHLKTITMILAKNPDLNWQNLNGQTALITAAENGHHRVVNHLLLHGANLHIRDNLGRDALMLAVEKNQVTIVKKLLAHGASKHTKDIAGQTALSIAKNKDHDEITSLLQLVN